MGAELVVAVVVEALDGCLLDRAVHPLDLAVGPRMVRLGQPVFDPVRLADHVEAHRPGADGVPVAGLLGELDAVVGQYGVDLVGHRLQQALQELPSRAPIRRFNELGDGELGGPVDAHEEIELTLGSLHLGDVNVEEPDGVTLELLSSGLVALDIRQARDAVTLKAAMQRRPCQVRDRGLQGVEAIVERQERMPSEGDDSRLLGLGQNRRARFRRTGLHILYRRALAPLRNRLRIDPQLPAQLRERSLRSLYCCSDSVRGRGAPVTNLSHVASFHSFERIAPSNRGIKQLEPGFWARAHAANLEVLGGALSSLQFKYEENVRKLSRMRRRLVRHIWYLKLRSTRIQKKCT